MKVTDEHVHDSKLLPKLVDDSTKPKKNITIVGKIIADGIYDSNSVFNCLAGNEIFPCVKVRRNTKAKKINHIHRNLSIISQNNNFQTCKDSVSYGKRWTSEIFFSCIKRTFGEYVYSVKFKNMVKEIILKASLYNKEP